MMNTPLLGLIVPCYNESAVIRNTVAQLHDLLTDLIAKSEIDAESFIGLIDDGSTDGTWREIEAMQPTFPSVKAIKLSRNFGHQNALLAGLFTFHEQADCLISIDADLQDDISVIQEMIAHYNAGSDIVYGVRKKRQTDSFFKKWTAIGFYRVMELLGVEIIFNHADYRLASQRVLNELCAYPEVNLFLRGIFPTLGFHTSHVYYDRLERSGGRSKYSFSRMLALACEGITSCSVRPLRLIALLGLAIFLGSLVLGVYAVYSYLKLDVVHGWTSIVIPLYFLGGIQLFSIGIIGEYLGKIYKEVKQRPRFIIERRLEQHEKDR